MTSANQHGGWLLTGCKLLAAVTVLGFVALASRAYYSEHLLTLAEVGRKTIHDYEELLSSSAAANSFNGTVRLRQADLLLSRGEYKKAIETLQASSPGTQHWQGWERQGVALERSAFGGAGTLDEADSAAALYEDVLTVYPNYKRGIERSAVLALKLGEWAMAESLASKLAEVGGNNGNVTYIRARAAGGVGQHGRAVELLGQLSASDQVTSDALYSQQEIQTLIKNLIGEAQ